MLTRQDGPGSILVDRAGGPGLLGEDRGGLESGVKQEKTSSASTCDAFITKKRRITQKIPL